MKPILKTLFLLFVTTACLTSDTATSSVPPVLPAPNLSMCSYSPASNGPQPKNWESPSWAWKSETSESYLVDAFVPVML